MACNYPITAYKCYDGSIVFEERKGAVASELRLPCGQCVGCQLERARQWSVRCMHEAQMHERNCFITLTYNDEHLPVYGNLEYDDFQRFMKRLRKRFGSKKIRFFMCGEYGDDRSRPHFHACLFGIDFDDREFLKVTKAGSRIYTSKVLDSVWTDKGGGSIGFATVGDVTFDSAGYVARYVMKKRLGRAGSKEYEALDFETGEVFQREKEFCRMSLKPGIGYSFYQKWKGDIFPHDYVVVKGKRCKPPRYYTKKLADEDPQCYAEIQERRGLNAVESASDNTPARLEVKEKVLIAASKFLKRELS